VSDHKRSFWSTVPGLVTGLAGLLTGIVGLITLLVQLGVLGGGSGNGSANQPDNTATTTSSTISGAAGAPGSGGGGSATSIAEPATFTVTPTALDFPPSDAKDKTLTVKNTSTNAGLTDVRANVTGSDADRFSVSLGTCTGRVAANLSCTLQVKFTPASGAALKKYSATLQVTAAGATRGAEVSLTASTLL